MYFFSLAIALSFELFGLKNTLLTFLTKRAVDLFKINQGKHEQMFA